MVGDHPVGRQIGGTFRVALTGEPLGFIQKRLEQVGFVVTADSLDDRNDAFKTHASIHMPFWQGLEVGGGGAVVLDKNVVPDLDDSGAVAVDFTHMPWHLLHVAEIRAKIVMDLRAGTAGTGLSHFPEVIFASTADEMRGNKTGLCQPNVTGFHIGRQVALIVHEVSCV